MKQFETKIYTFSEIEKMGGFEEIKKQGYEYYEFYHQLPNGEFETHWVEVFKSL